MRSTFKVLFYVNGSKEKNGIRCKLTGYNGGSIEFLGYTPETEALLEKERQIKDQLKQSPV